MDVALWKVGNAVGSHFRRIHTDIGCLFGVCSTARERDSPYMVSKTVNLPLYHSIELLRNTSACSFSCAFYCCLRSSPFAAASSDQTQVTPRPAPSRLERDAAEPLRSAPFVLIAIPELAYTLDRADGCTRSARYRPAILCDGMRGFLSGGSGSPAAGAKGEKAPDGPEVRQRGLSTAAAAAIAARLTCGEDAHRMRQSSSTMRRAMSCST